MPTILITGANRGLGLEFVRQYSTEGWQIIATCRDPEKADELKALRSDKIRIEQLDTVNTASITALAPKLKGVVIDVLINNAGIYSGAAKSVNAAQGDKGQEFGTIDAEAWDKVLRVNTIAPIMITQTLLPLLNKKGGKVVNITSKMGAIGEIGGGAVAYRSSKAALNAAMKSILNDLTSQGIAIVNLHPGWVQTDMGSMNAPLKPEVSIAGMRKVIAELTVKNSGQFLGYDGKTIAW